MESITQKEKISGKFYSKQGLWSLFLMCALPLHLWTIILTLNDISWVSERTDLWDAIGVMSYGLIFTFVESLIIFLITALLGLLISKVWKEEVRISLLSIIIVILSLWAILNHSYFLWEWSLPDGIIGFIAYSTHPLRTLYGLVLFLVGLSFTVPVHLVLKSSKFLQLILVSMEKLSLLMSVYLILDITGAIIVIIRNLG